MSGVLSMIGLFTVLLAGVLFIIALCAFVSMCCRNNDKVKVLSDEIDDIMVKNIELENKLDTLEALHNDLDNKVVDLEVTLGKLRSNVMLLDTRFGGLEAELREYTEGNG